MPAWHGPACDTLLHNYGISEEAPAYLCAQQGLPSSPRDGSDRALTVTTGKGTPGAVPGPAAASSIAIPVRGPTEAEPGARIYPTRSETTSLPPIAEADTELRSASGLLAAERQATASMPVAHSPAHASSLLRWQLGRAAAHPHSAPPVSTADDSTAVSDSGSSMGADRQCTQADAAVTAQEQSASTSDVGSLKRVTWDIPAASSPHQQSEAGSAAQPQQEWAEQQPAQQQESEHSLPPQEQQMYDSFDHHRQQPHAHPAIMQLPATPFSSSRIPLPPGPYDVHVGMAFTDFLPWPRSRSTASQPCAHHCSPCPEPHDSASHASRAASQQSAEERGHLLSPQHPYNPVSLPPAEPMQHQSALQHGSSAAASSQADDCEAGLVLSADGGAVLMQDPDGTQHFVLLVSDLKKHAEAKEMAVIQSTSADEGDTYEVCLPLPNAHHASPALCRMQLAVAGRIQHASRC